MSDLNDIARGGTRAGHSLLEALAALALASVGVIGFMHAQHVRELSETDLLARTHAAMLARDIARKLSANPAALARYRTTYGAPPAFTADCRRTACGRGELATFHVAHWKCRLGRWLQHTTCRDVLKTRGLLPGGDGHIRPHGDGADIVVRWIDANAAPQSFELRHVPPRR